MDPRAEYLTSPLQGFRRVGGGDASIEPDAGRRPSEMLGLHRERDGDRLRLFDPATGQYLLTRLERQQAAERSAEGERRRAEAAVADQRRLAEENERLRPEIEALRGRRG
jgi:hypothetical protein